MGEHADHFLEAGQQVAGGLEVDVGGAEFRIEADHPVRRGVQHFAQLHLHVALVALLLAEQQAEIRAASADLADAAVAGVAVGYFLVEGDVARQHVALVRATALDVITGDQRQRQVDGGVAGVRRYVQAQRLALGTEVEQTAVRQYPTGLAHHQLAHVEKLAVDLQFEEPPGVAVQFLRTHLELVIEVAIVLLEMLWSQQHAFLPDDFMLAHRLRSCSSSRLRMPRSSSRRLAALRCCSSMAMT